ncbi:MAG TPA: transglutaminase domain-containing protein [Chitinophagaceae bacterium]|nr:transglutaminase domain-containing protein [Chitinophagaceae bacterium]
MRNITSTLLLALMAFIANGQKTVVNPYASIDKKMLEIPAAQTTTTAAIAQYVQSNFTSNTDKARAIFIWTASTISYDLDNMFAINFYEKQEDKINKPLKTHKGICENYAAVFTDICIKSGIPSYVVVGYTRQSGFTDYIPHAWCAALIDNEWRLFDPTWGSGYVANGHFIKRINNNYCLAQPSALIKSHMPFDYLWQFLYHPVSNQAFYEGKTQEAGTSPYFMFRDSIVVYEQQDSIGQLKAAARRIEQNGVKNSMIFDRLHHIEAQLEAYEQRHAIQVENERQATIAGLYNGAVADYNAAINDYNKFIAFRNQQFLPAEPDSAIQAMLTSAATKLVRSKEQLSAIRQPGASLAAMITQQQEAVQSIQARVQEQQEWLQLYFSKPKSKRKAMFYEKKTSWLGISLR